MPESGVDYGLWTREPVVISDDGAWAYYRIKTGLEQGDIMIRLAVTQEVLNNADVMKAFSAHALEMAIDSHREDMLDELGWEIRG